MPKRKASSTSSQQETFEFSCIVTISCLCKRAGKHTIQNKDKINNQVFNSHTWRPIVFFQPGMQDMSLTICAFKLLVEWY